jgi:hypothetical protein
MDSVRETSIEQSDGAKLDARLEGPYPVTEVAHILGTHQLAEPYRAELAGWTASGRHKKFFTRNQSIHGS